MSAQAPEFNLDRAVNVEHNVDATGKKWVIKTAPRSTMLHCRPEPDRADSVIPKNMIGLWTGIAQIEAELKKYINLTWDEAERITATHKRKAEAAAEQAKIAKSAPKPSKSTAPKPSKSTKD